jgi:hypothetical protein
MNKTDGRAKSLFIASDGNLYPDYLVCSGKISGNGGSPCPLAQNGHMPDPQPLDPNSPNYSIDKGKAGELCPPCIKQQLGHLGHWDGHRGQNYPEELKPLRLFKCSQWHWLVVLGLRHDNPTQVK